MSDYTNEHHDDFETSVTGRLDDALKNGKRRDLKQLLIYVVGVLIAAMVMWFIVHYVEDRNRFEAAVTRNCQTTKTNTQSFNAFVWTLIRTTKSSTLLTKAQVRERVTQYRALYQTVPHCPPLKK